MSISVEMNGLRFRLEGQFNGRQSAVKQYLDCHRLYGWERIENLVLDRPSMPLEFGSATHLFLQERKRGVPLASAITTGLQRLVQNYPPAIYDLEMDLVEKHRELAKNMWPAYEAYWAGETDPMIPLGQEIKGRVEVGEGTGVFLVFQLDQLVSYVDNFWLVDYKTMARNDDRDFQKYEIDMQPTAYIYGASKVLGKRIAGIVIDGLIKTKVPQFRRESYLRTDDEILEFESEFVEVCQEIAWRHTRVNQGEDWKTVFYKNTKQCFRFYTCPMLQLCLKDTPMNRMAYRQRDRDYMDEPRILDGTVNAETGEVKE